MPRLVESQVYQVDLDFRVENNLAPKMIRRPSLPARPVACCDAGGSKPGPCGLPGQGSDLTVDDSTARSEKVRVGSNQVMNSPLNQCYVTCMLVSRPIEDTTRYRG